MAASSIFATVRIDDPKKAEAFIDALNFGYGGGNRRDKYTLV